MSLLAACALTPINSDVSATAKLPAALLADTETTETIARHDATIFEAAFRTCDGEALRRVMADDLEFYHDKYGIIASSLDEFLDGTLPDCERRRSGEQPYLERRIGPGSMVVRRIGNDAVMQTGSHSFWLREPGQDIRKVETGLFTHIWVKTDGDYKIKRVISYDHANVAP